MKKGIKQRYITSAFILLLSTVVVKVISAVYKIPLTNYIGATGRGYFSVAYNLCLPIHALTMGAFPIALTKLVSSYEAKGDTLRIKALRKASKKLFFIIGLVGTVVMFAVSKPYAQFVASSPKSIYTALALAPSIFFSCLCACHRAFAEGYMDMKPTAVSQLIEALFKMIFGLLFARFCMSYLYDFYVENGTVFGVIMTEEEALAAIYPVTSAFSMLGATLGSIAAYIFAAVYTRNKYDNFPPDSVDVKSAYNEMLACCVPLVAATVVQSISNFADTSSIQYFLSLCDEKILLSQYPSAGEDVYTYVFGIYASALDFKNLIPAIVMALGITAVPAVSSAFESGDQRFSSLLTSIFKYTVILSVGGGLALSLFNKDILNLFYAQSHPDIVSGASKLLFYFGVTALPCAAASTSVFCTQALGFAKKTVAPFAVSAVIRIVLNYFLVCNSEINIIGTAFSNFAGFLIILIWNMITIRKYTHARFKISDIFVKPVICAVLTYFTVLSLKNTLFADFGSLTVFVLSVLVCLLLFFILLFLLKCVSSKEIKLLK